MILILIGLSPKTSQREKLWDSRIYPGSEIRYYLPPPVWSSRTVRNRKLYRYTLESQAIALKVLIRVFMLWVEDFIDLSVLLRVELKHH